MSSVRAASSSESNADLGVADWINKYGLSFVAHAVWSDNVDGVISSGYVESAECQLRKKHQVSFEKYGQYGQRGVLSIKDQVKKIQDKEITYPPNPVTIHTNHTMTLMEALKFFVHLSDEDCDKISKTSLNEPLLLSLKNMKTCKAVRRKGNLWNTEVTLEGIPLASYKDHEIRSAYSRFDTQVAIDCCSEDPIDKRLSAVWEANKALRANQKELHSELLNFRYCEIARSPLCSSVRAGYNKIYWSYGNVVVLRGNPEKILSAYNLSDDFRKKDAKLENGQEVFLLEPFENGGEFFSLDLKQEDTIVLAPKAIILGYSNSSGIKFFAFEEMSSSQLDFFKVPQSLRPKNNATQELPTPSPSFSLTDAKKTSLAVYSLLAPSQPGGLLEEPSHASTKTHVASLTQ